MRKVTITKRVWISTAHRQLNDPSDCGFLHGHNWVISAKISGEIGLLGYIVDFKQIKNVIMGLDHKVILCKDDPLCRVLVDNGQHVYEIPMNPTCENLAIYIGNILEHIFPGIKVDIQVFENLEAYAEAIHESD
jgi:6-pyruvoyltetrahydropterin/6-carboxytetrahydropterin synthase